MYDTIQWIQEIGTVFYSNEYQYSSSGIPTGIRSSTFCYNLLSFNDYFKVRSATHKLNNKTIPIQKQIFLKENEAIDQRISDAMYYSLRGQKVFARNGSQLLILNNLANSTK